ncbi:hypothetical protein I4U23_022359 [Adineta vaga]|nr:hypothetical protein I4U23_022359 [Adineta vaga]
MSSLLIKIDGDKPSMWNFMFEGMKYVLNDSSICICSSSTVATCCYMFNALLKSTLESGTNNIAIFFGIETNLLFISPPYTFPFDTLNTTPSVIEVVDANSDVFLDLIVGNQRTTYFSSSAVLYPPYRNAKLYDIFINSGNGYRFNSVCPSSCQVSANVILITVGDFDQEGKQNDLGLCTSDGYVEILLSTKFYYLGYYSWISNHMYENPLSLVKGKFNDDDLDDIALISPNSDTLQTLIAYNDNRFVQHIYLTDVHPTSLARINFNNDTIDDLAVLYCNGTVNIFVGTNIGLFKRSPFTFGITDRNMDDECLQLLKVSDLNNDGNDDIIIVDAGKNVIKIFLVINCIE